jgi:UPF0042 nucleotide-binding protein
VIEAPSLEVLIVTGMSGAGKSTALHALEDAGYYCVDNLPPPVVEQTLESLKVAGCRRIALGVDIRLRAFLEDAPKVIENLMLKTTYTVSILFLDASDELLARRFSTTRRPHPLSALPSVDVREVLEGVRLERALLAPLREMASELIETTTISVHDLRRTVLRTFDPDANPGGGMFVRILSFGFKYGRPVDADVILDVRFLPNPYFDDDLRDLSGKDEGVRRYVFDNPLTGEFLTRTLSLLSFCVPRFKDEGKSYVTIAIGCTGGRHRSVAVTEELAKRLAEALGFSVDAVHRDLVKGDPPRSNISERREAPGALPRTS